MMRHISMLAFIIGTMNLGNSQAFLSAPIEGIQGEDWIIVNYVDWDTVGIFDHNCGSKTYDGHQGTDYTLQSFVRMEEGVNVLAAANGIVTFVKDGLFDEETTSNPAKGLGNYIAIRHENDYYSYYGHLKTNSILVEVGDEVLMSDVIAQVGSSGNSTDPHLHFELWYDSLYVVDPYGGNCGNQESLFFNPEEYKEELAVWDSGISLSNDLSLDDLRFRNLSLEKPFMIDTDSDSDLYYWVQLYGIREGIEIKFEWYTPTNELWFEFDINADQDYWYAYYWTYIFHDNLVPGAWNVRMLYDGEEINRETFQVGELSGLSELNTDLCKLYENYSIPFLKNTAEINLQMFNTRGQNVTQLDHLNAGIYFLQIKQNDKFCVIKKLIEE